MSAAQAVRHPGAAAAADVLVYAYAELPPEIALEPTAVIEASGTERTCA